jgi:glycosyltransferase involved in cell wall biosynthesis
LKPYEALSTGIPLVVSDLPALRTIVEHSGAGRTFAPGKPQDLAAVIEDLLRDPVGLAEMGERGAEHVRREHTWHRNAQRYLDVYQRFGSP